MRTALLRLPLAVSLLPALSLFGCAAASPKGPGRLDGRMALAAASDTAKEMELVMEADGTISKISVNDKSTAPVPDELRALASRRFPGSTLAESELEIYADAGVVHEVELRTADGKECELSMNAAGEFRYTECIVAASALPAPVAKTLNATAPNPEVTEAELREPASGANEYRIEVKSQGRKWYLRIGLDGALLSRSILLPAEVRIPLP